MSKENHYLCRMKVLYLIRRCAPLDGAARTLLRLIESNPSVEAHIVCRYSFGRIDGVAVDEVDSRAALQTVIADGNYDIIHYFRTSGYELFDWAVKSLHRLKLDIPIITTICQRPSYPQLLPSVAELTRSTRVVMIDRAAMRDPLFDFVATDRKRHIYFGATQRDIELTERLAAAWVPTPGQVIFGRGSTPGKVPADYCKITDRITTPGKHVVIAGIPADSSVRRQAEGRDYVEMVDALPYDEWLKLCVEFDVFLYYLPKMGHSSIDGTLGQAMMLGKPVVYYGPPAPAERLVHGVNGFVAKDPSEIPAYCDRLGADAELRHRMGAAARKSTVSDFSMAACVRAYNALYKEVVSEVKAGRKPVPVKVPISYRKHFARYSWRGWLRSELAGSVIERLSHRLKPLPERT